MQPKPNTSCFEVKVFWAEGELFDIFPPLLEIRARKALLLLKVKKRVSQHLFTEIFSPSPQRDLDLRSERMTSAFVFNPAPLCENKLIQSDKSKRLREGQIRVVAAVEKITMLATQRELTGFKPHTTIAMLHAGETVSRKGLAVSWL